MKKMFFLLVIWMSAIAALHASEVRDTIAPRKLTPLVGAGCVINQIDKNLIEAIAGTSDLDYIVDTNPNNYASFGSVLSAAVAYNPTIAVKNMNHVYEAGTTAGYVIQAVSGTGSNLLNVDVLEMFWIETYLDGEKQETSKDTENTGGTLLNLNLITVASNGKTKVAVKTTKPFDEIRISVSGVNADVLSNLKIYYAFAGENEIKPITKSKYPAASVHAASVTGIGSEWTTAMWNWPSAKENLVGEGSENKGVGFGTLSNLLTEPRVTIDAGETIPANTEVGFMIEHGSVLALNLLNNTILTTYDADNNEIESKTFVSVLGLTAIGGGRTLISMVTTQPCRQIKIKFGGLNIDVGGTKIFYAYTRDANVEIEETCDLKISADITVCGGSEVQLTGTSGIEWSIVSQPMYASATVDATGKVTNMNQAGEYVIKATLGACTDSLTITKGSVPGVSYNCNRPIVGDGIIPFSPKGGGCLLCLATGTNGNVENVTDVDLTNYVEYTQGLDLASNTSVFGIENTQGVYNESGTTPVRVGFIMQATNQFLNVNLLKFFVIKTYLDGKEQESSLVEENNAIGADLIGGSDNQVRFSFVATKPFNQVALWTAGVLNLNISKFRIYYAFEEPANAGCLTGNSGVNACISLLSASEYGAQIAYNHTGFGGIANVGAFMTNLSDAVDGDISSYALVNKVAGVGGSATLSVKINRVIGSGYQAGFIVQDQTWVTNVDLLSLVRIKTYLNGVQTGDEFGTPGVLNLDLIGSGGKSLITVTPTMPFDEIQLDISGLLDAAVNTQVFGAFVRKDTDGDGIPDCIDKNPCGLDLVASVVSASCLNSPVVIAIANRDDGVYKLINGTEEYAFVNDTVSFMPQTWGHQSYSITKDNDVIYENLLVTVHDTLTTWTGSVSKDWNDWDNWSNGVPSGCTNVIIPSPADFGTGNPRYPELSENGMNYVCNNIHFKPEAELIHSERLDYSTAWVELSVIGKKRRMATIPLAETYSGDLFIASNYPDTIDTRPYFQLEVETIRRANPRTNGYLWNGSGWIAFPNRLNTLLKSGFSVEAIPGSLPDNATFSYRFPKGETVYHNYNYSGVEIPNDSVIIERNDKLGRFIWETQDNNGVYLDTITTNSATNKFVVGNPYMSHLSVSKFLEANGSHLENSIQTISIDGEPDTLSVGDLIPPMTAFFVFSKTSYTSLEVVFTPDMMVQKNYANTNAAPQTRSALQNGNASQLSVSSLKAYTRGGEGIIESAGKIQNLQVFNVAGRLLISKQNVSSPVHVTLSEGVNIIKVQTENETRTFKLIK